jgi:hypothetical protein
MMGENTCLACHLVVHTYASSASCAHIDLVLSWDMVINLNTSIWLSNFTSTSKDCQKCSESTESNRSHPSSPKILVADPSRKSFSKVKWPVSQWCHVAKFPRHSDLVVYFYLLDWWHVHWFNFSTSNRCLRLLDPQIFSFLLMRSLTLLIV